MALITRAGTLIRLIIASILTGRVCITVSVKLAAALRSFLQFLPLNSGSRRIQFRAMIMMCATSCSCVKDHAEKSEDFCCSVKHRSIRKDEARDSIVNATSLSLPN